MAGISDVLLQVREVADQFAVEQEYLRWQTDALLALQEASEAYLTHLFEDAYVVPMRDSSCATAGVRELPRDCC